MRHLCSFMGAALLFGVLAAACNGIAGIDDIEGPECLDRSDCAAAGECTQVTCAEGLCKYTIAETKTKCARGECDEKGTCVECITDAPCSGTPLQPHCVNPDRKCVECTDDQHCSNGDERCIGMRCMACDKSVPCPLSGNICSETFRRCVECEKATDCPTGKLPNEQCWTSVCVEGSCLPTPTQGEDCDGECKDGVCVPP
jgi:hypothetical protein